MDMYSKYKSILGYQTGDDGVDSYGVNHSGFSIRDELLYQQARQQREQRLIQNYNTQGITENYPQYNTNFWNNTDNNYGFGSSDISGNIENMQQMQTSTSPNVSGCTCASTGKENCPIHKWLADNSSLDYNQTQLGQPQQLNQPQAQPTSQGQVSNNQPNIFEEELKKAEQLASAGLNGVSRGWYDEYEGMAGGIGYGIASLNPKWNKQGESIGNAFKRGYQEARDNRRQVLADAYSEQPLLATAMEMIGGASKSPLDALGGKSRFWPVLSGMVYGSGVTNQKDPYEYAKNIGLGTVGNLIGDKINANVFSANANPLVRNAINEVAGKSVSISFEGMSNTQEEDDEEKKRKLCRMLGFY